MVVIDVVDEHTGDNVDKHVVISTAEKKSVNKGTDRENVLLKSESNLKISGIDS